jgi:flagellin
MATASLSAIDAAVDAVSAMRSGLGAVQNRLEHALSVTGVYQENLTSAESRIRDVDMAEEMVTLTKNQILQQAGTAMLAQANQAPQSVLSLLRG